MREITPPGSRHKVGPSLSSARKYLFFCLYLSQDLYNDFDLGLNNGDEIMSGSAFMMNKSVLGTGQVFHVEPLI